MKTTGELLARIIKFLVIKTETSLLNRPEPKRVKEKVFFVANALIILLLVSGSVSSTYMENWSFLEGLYAWFITFTTIGFGDYVPLESYARRAAHGEISEARVVFYGIIFDLPYLVGLSLVSCILTCLVESMDQIRDFRDRSFNCISSFFSLGRRFFCRERSSYNVKEEGNCAHGTSQEMT